MGHARCLPCVDGLNTEVTELHICSFDAKCSRSQIFFKNYFIYFPPHQGCSVKTNFLINKEAQNKGRQVFQLGFGDFCISRSNSTRSFPSSFFSLTHHAFCLHFLSEGSCCPRSVCHGEHKLFSLGRSDSSIGVYKQAGVTCTNLSSCPPPPADMEICPCNRLSRWFGVSDPPHPSFLCMRWVTQAAALGIPVQLIILHPLRHSSL